MKAANFTSRTEYLTWRAEWKAEYKELSTKIRKLKLALKVEQRKPLKDNGYGGFTYEPAFYTVNWELIQAQNTARSMLEELKAAKVRSQEQWLASRQLKVAA